jgi:hypothetical protein
MLTALLTDNTETGSEVLTPSDFWQPVINNPVTIKASAENLILVK